MYLQSRNIIIYSSYFRPTRFSITDLKKCIKIQCTKFQVHREALRFIFENIESNVVKKHEEFLILMVGNLPVKAPGTGLV